jgi:7-cyano-7-deazaguanine synthase
MEAMVLFSGGVDSTTCLARAVEKHGASEVMALSIYYGQRHQKEIQCAEKLVQYYGVQWKTLDLARIFADSSCSLLQGAAEEVPKESYAEQLKTTGGAPVSTYVPFRNGLFLSAAASVALSHGCKIIYYGPHADDAAGNAYPDCSVTFHNAMATAIYEGSGKQLRVVAPFVEMTKKDIVKLGLALNVPYEMTWSCYEGSDRPCGVCGTCRDRAAAFRANGVSDPAYR